MTTINVSDETHGNVLKLQAALNLTSTSGKYTLDATVNTAVIQCLGGTSFTFVQQPVSQMAYTATSFNTQTATPTACFSMAGNAPIISQVYSENTSSGVTRLSLRRDK